MDNVDIWFGDGQYFLVLPYILEDELIYVCITMMNMYEALLAATIDKYLSHGN